MDIDAPVGEGTEPAVAVGGGSSTRPLDSTAQMANANAADWQEEVYQKIKSMKEMYLPGLTDVYHKIVSTVQQHPQHEQIEKLQMFKKMLECVTFFLRLNKHEIQLSHKQKLLFAEKCISFFLHKPREPASSPLQGQLPQSSMHTSQWSETGKGDATASMEFESYTSSVEAPLDSKAQTGNASGADWQEEVYQKIKSLKEMHLSELNELYQRIAFEVQQRPHYERIEKLKKLKYMLECTAFFLRLNKHEIQLCHKEKLPSVEKHISFFVRPLQRHRPQPSMHTSQAPAMDPEEQDIASEFARLLSLTD